MRKNIFLILSFALIVACTGNKQNGASESNVEENQLVEQTASDADFNTFFAQFKADSVFQKSRIHFPLQYKNYEEEELTVEQIVEKNGNTVISTGTNRMPLVQTTLTHKILF